MISALENQARTFGCSPRLNFEPVSWLIRASSIVVLLWCLVGAMPAQNYTVLGSQTSLPGAFTHPTGVAADLSGRVFVADANELHLVYPQWGSSGKYVTGLSYPPYSVAVDSIGNLFVSPTYPTETYLFANGATPAVPLCQGAGGGQTDLATGINEPGYVWTASANQIAVCSQKSGKQVLYTESTSVFAPAVDAFEDFFFADGTGTVYEATPTAIKAIGNFGPFAVNALAVDGGGNLFVAVNHPTASIVEVAAGTTTQIPLGSGFTNPYAIAVDGRGNLFVADYGNNRVEEIQTRSLSFPPIVTCTSSFSTSSNPCSETMQFTVSFNQAVMVPKVLTMGAANQDFTLASVSGCGTALPTVCTYTIKFSPRFAGMRRGALQIPNSSGNLLLQIPLYGIGFAEQPSFGPSAATVVLPISGLNEPEAIAADDAGNVFISDTYNNRIVELPAGGGAQKTVVSGLANPLGIALDGAGDLFIADWGHKRVLEVVPSTGASWTVGTGIGGPAGVAVDGAGDVFISDYTNNRVVEVPSGPGGQTVIASLNGPRGLAVDASGNVYVAASIAGEIVKVSPLGAQSIVYTGSPYGVAVDAAGDLYIANYSTAGLVELTASGTTIPYTTGALYPGGVAVDGAGNIYIADSWNNRALEVTASKPPTVQFAATPVGLVSTDSPRTVEVSNVGVNYPLTLTSETTPADFPSGSSTSNCTSASFGPIPPGFECGVAIDFKPTVAGALSESIVMARSAPAASLSIGVSGTGIATQSAALASPAANSTLPGATVTFSWSGGVGVSAYLLSLGTTGVGSSNIYNTSFSATTTSATVTGIPTTGAKLYARLWSKINGAWQSRDYVFTEAP